MDFCVQGGAGVVGGRMSSYSQSRRTGEIARRRETCAESFKLFLISVSCPFFGGVECNDCISLAFLKTWGVSARRNLYPKPVPGTAQFHEIKTVKHNGIVQLYASKLSGEEGKKINLTLK